MEALEPCDECDGAGVYDCDECDGSGERECDLGHEHECEDCGGKGKGIVCAECEGCGSAEALNAWRQQRAMAILPRAIQVALCRAALASPHHDAVSWRGGILLLRGIPEDVVALVPGEKGEVSEYAGIGLERRRARTVVVFDGTPPKSWIKETLARVAEVAA